ncbi:MAG: methionyl-tRNA formyltransferase [bacterium]
MKILFMGTPDFAVPSLHAFVNSHHELVGVVTTPDKPVGRGLKIQPSPIKKVALELNLPIFQPAELTNSEFIQKIHQLRAQLFVVVAFRILPPEVFLLPAKGTINLHPSLLPKYRGAAPINWAIINGEKETGITTIFIQKRVDTGEIILQKKVVIANNETAGELHDKLAKLGADLVLETANLIEKGSIPRIQQTGPVTQAPKLTRELAHIHWQKSNLEIHNLIRGLSPSPGAYTYLNNKIMKILRSQLSLNSDMNGRPGEVLLVGSKKGRLIVATGAGNLEILELQPEGKRRMTTEEYLRGHTIKTGEKFG